MTLAGFPHSDTPGSKPACGSPRLFAACHVLPRRLVPRHPPRALVRLISLLPPPALDTLLPDYPLYPNCQTAETTRAPLAGSARTVCEKKKSEEWTVDSREPFRRGRVPRLTRRLQKGGDPAAGSPTATLLRLRPSHRACLRPLPPLRVGSRTSGAPGFHGVTGGVYKARERIHRGVADPRLLAIPASCSRVADCNPNLDRLLAIGSPSPVGDALYRPL